MVWMYDHRETIDRSLYMGQNDLPAYGVQT
jgi:hypothetical protein